MKQSLFEGGVIAYIEIFSHQNVKVNSHNQKQNVVKLMMNTKKKNTKVDRLYVPA